MAEHWCTLHNTDFFKTPKMRTYAHPIEDENGETIGWCNEKDLKKVQDLPAQPDDQMLPEHQIEIDKAKAEVTPPAPQAVGMMTKEIGDMIRAKMLMPLFGGKITTELLGWYRSQVFGITRIKYDGKDLPEIKSKE